MWNGAGLGWRGLILYFHSWGCAGEAVGGGTAFSAFSLAFTAFRLAFPSLDR